jgi:hypothetical protein
MGWKLGEDEREARLLLKILEVLEEIRDRLPKPPEYLPTVGMSITAQSSSSAKSRKE